MKTFKTVELLRVRMVFYGISLLFVIVLVKLFTLQVVQHNHWVRIAKAQHTGVHKVEAQRGEVYTQDSYPIALSGFTYELYVDPSVYDGTEEDLSKIFDLVYQDLPEEMAPLKDGKREHWKMALNDRSLKFYSLEKQITPTLKTLIEGDSHSGLGFLAVPSRTYPNNETYSHILGFVGKDTNGETKGYFGVEGFYDGDLRGVDGFVVQESSAGGSPIFFGEYSSYDALNGGNLTLTIDRVMQNISYESIKNAVEKFGAESGTIIIVNPRTGAIQALANYPTYSPANYSFHYSEDANVFINKAVSSTYEPGSVIKALTMAAALDSKAVSTNTTVMDSGPEYYSGHKVDNWDGKHHGEISMAEVLQLSNNIGAAKVGFRVGSENLHKYFTNFGLNRKLGVDLEGEESGTITNPDTWYDIDLASASFGQGISTTPLQVVMAFGAIANDGVLMKPYIVEKMVKDGRTIENKPIELNRVLSKETSETMVLLLTKAVSDGEAKYFVSDKYYVAGKTGTAQIAENGEYLADKTNATFVGFLPSYKDFVMLVKLEKPSSSVYASETAVPVWMEVSEGIATYLSLPPDK